MFVELSQGSLYHVGLVDLIHHGTGFYERSFATSEQLIDWLKNRFQNNPSLDQTALIAVRRGDLGELLTSDDASQYTPDNGDIEIGRKFVYTKYGLRYRELSRGSG